MARSTHRDHYRAEPKPISQGVWLLATMAIAAIILSIMGTRLAEADRTGSQPVISDQDLLELAAPVDSDENPAIGTDPAIATDPAIGTGRATHPDSVTDPGGSGDGPGVTVPAAPRAIAGSLNGLIASTDTTATTEQPMSRQDRGRAALDTISYPWEQLLPEWTIDFLPERDGLYGLTLVPERRIEVYVRDGQTTAFLAHVIAHELGHAVDVTLNTGPDRRRWEAARNIDSASWWPGDGATDFSTGAGDFAESFAAWQVGSQSFRSKLGSPPDAEQIGLLAELSAG